MAMQPLFEREEILRRLRETIASKRPIITAGCSAGIIAKCAALGGSDLIVVYSTGKSRLKGLPTTRLGDSNAITLEMADEILNVAGNTPVVGGIEATDPTRLNLKKLLSQFVQVGYSGVINFPTIGIWPDQRRRGEKVKLGFEREIEMIRLARRMNIFTMAYVGSRKDAEAMVEAGVDCLVAHTGPTEGGLVGFKYEGSLEKAACLVKDILTEGKKRKNEVICLAHGGPVSTPKHTSYIYAQTSAVGFVAASSIERIPVEEAVIEITKRFKRVPLSSLSPSLIKEPTSIIAGMDQIVIGVADFQKSLEFYINLLGGTLIDISPEMKEKTTQGRRNGPIAGRRIAFLDFFGMKLKLVETIHSPQKDGGIEISLKASDGRFAFQKFKEEGIISLGEPVELAGGGYQFYICDPDGRRIEICQPPKESND
jgi:predicted TIM-barrel enzyme/catechol 2,3-dioxygenase-like lactoylglutathione lyase family enzyme